MMKRLLRLMTGVSYVVVLPALALIATFGFYVAIYDGPKHVDWYWRVAGLVFWVVSSWLLTDLLWRIGDEGVERPTKLVYRLHDKGYYIKSYRDGDVNEVEVLQEALNGTG